MIVNNACVTAANDQLSSACMQGQEIAIFVQLRVAHFMLARDAKDRMISLWWLDAYALGCSLCCRLNSCVWIRDTPSFSQMPPDPGPVL